MFKGLFILVASLAILAGCDSAPPGAPSNSSKNGGVELTVLAGSELKALESYRSEIAAATGVDVNFKWVGTLDGADQVKAGGVADAALFANDKFLVMNGVTKFVGKEKVFFSPVAVGVKNEVATRLGWDSKRPSWKEIAEVSGLGQFKYAMTTPSSSMSGFSGIVSVASSASPNNELTSVEAVSSGVLKKFFTGHKLSAASSGWLADAFMREQATLDGMVNYESVLFDVNRRMGGAMKIIYPSDGSVIADYPFVLFSAEKKASWEKVVAFLKTKEMQSRIAKEMFFRPVSPEAAQESKGIFSVDVVDIPVPSNTEVLVSLLIGYLEDYKTPARIFFVLDTSGSMRGERIQSLRDSISNIAGVDASFSGRMSQFRNREKVSFITFSDEVNAPVDFEFTKENIKQAFNSIQNSASGLNANGGTAIYDALMLAYQTAKAEYSKNGNYSYSIVLMSDGENTAGRDYGQFMAFLKQNHNSDYPIRIFTMGFGESNDQEMKDVAEFTGGKFFDTKKEKQNALQKAFKEIRGYQ